MRCVLLYGRAWKWPSSIFVENQHHSPVHGRRTMLSCVLQTFVRHRQFITDKILLLQQMLNANFWWVFRLQCLNSCRVVPGWVYIWHQKNVSIWSNLTRTSDKKNINFRMRYNLSAKIISKFKHVNPLCEIWLEFQDFSIANQSCLCRLIVVEKIEPINWIFTRGSGFVRNTYCVQWKINH